MNMTDNTVAASAFWGNQHDDVSDTWRKRRPGPVGNPLGDATVMLPRRMEPHAARTPKPARRTWVVVASVLVFHLALLWALQSGLLKRVVAVIVPVQMISDFIEPPAPKVTPPPPQPPAPAKPVVRKPQVPSLAPAPVPLAVADHHPAPDTPRVALAPQAPLPPIAAPIAPVPVAEPSHPAPPRVELPSSDADYLQNPKPVYPAPSKRLGEQGVVVHSVLIGTDGLPVSAKLVKSSGFDRLDQAAYTAVMRWRYTPGKRNGTPAAMAFNVPIAWVLE
jgi:protein TonB